MAGVPSFAQASEGKQPVFRGTGDIVRVFATVSDRDGRLITTLTQGDFEVRDEGIGIERPQLKRIFKRFYRVPSDDVYSRSGTGLGLYVVAALVRNLGGKIAAHSEGHMRGTRISVRLPVAVAGEAR